ncbi:hypothetical protein M0813_18446 [Anaeramoeba flamelloides]|uniref:Uncharacterized protein n=1 Tax=Anaeramoeba flamelloides TaxID=1746091 RepID=A0ABQ8YTF4_9EUKA|nr:hypothetical protein M0813_18446 [Anaeramoeba flamelloides]
MSENKVFLKVSTHIPHLAITFTSKKLCKSWCGELLDFKRHLRNKKIIKLLPTLKFEIKIKISTSTKSQHATITFSSKKLVIKNRNNYKFKIIFFGKFSAVSPLKPRISSKIRVYFNLYNKQILILKYSKKTLKIEQVNILFKKRCELFNFLKFFDNYILCTSNFHEDFERSLNDGNNNVNNKKDDQIIKKHFKSISKAMGTTKHNIEYNNSPTTTTDINDNIANKNKNKNKNDDDDDDDGDSGGSGNDSDGNINLVINHPNKIQYKTITVHDRMQSCNTTFTGHFQKRNKTLAKMPLNVIKNIELSPISKIKANKKTSLLEQKDENKLIKKECQEKRKHTKNKKNYSKKKTHVLFEINTTTTFNKELNPGKLIISENGISIEWDKETKISSKSWLFSSQLRIFRHKRLENWCKFLFYSKKGFFIKFQNILRCEYFFYIFTAIQMNHQREKKKNLLFKKKFPKSVRDDKLRRMSTGYLNYSSQINLKNIRTKISKYNGNENNIKKKKQKMKTKKNKKKNKLTQIKNKGNNNSERFKMKKKSFQIKILEKNKKISSSILLKSNFFIITKSNHNLISTYYGHYYKKNQIFQSIKSGILELSINFEKNLWLTICFSSLTSAENFILDFNERKKLLLINRNN